MDRLPTTSVLDRREQGHFLAHVQVVVIAANMDIPVYRVSRNVRSCRHDVFVLFLVRQIIDGCIGHDHRPGNRIVQKIRNPFAAHVNSWCEPLSTFQVFLRGLESHNEFLSLEVCGLLVERGT